MSDEYTVQAKLYPDGRVVEVLPDGTERPFDDDTDWERLNNMTEDEIEANALSDPDNPPLTEEELSRLRPVVNAFLIRSELGLSQLEFAETFGLDLEELQHWERIWFVPDEVAANYLRVIQHNPEVVISALAASRANAGRS